jgi:uncharacterized membrane protein YdbT with pleckstrin-like domain
VEVLGVSGGSSDVSGGVLWSGKPWIVPSAVGWSVLIVVVAVVVFWLEFFFGVANAIIVMPLVLWTGLVFLVIWVIVIVRLALLRVTHRYILREDSLEVRTGVFTSKLYVVVPSGFSDLEAVQSFLGRITNTGDIFLRSQSETERRMVKVRNPLKVAEQIRKVMARPIVRMDNRSRLE